ncbi:zinc knuckle domain protein [Aspergillus neoniger CBS 115656]|uniref:CCHC-type domain-containing protein n=1 Tax=Aspergillus neoniger (strain CBS 115656) TaxID=1448310 RepID=A0A318Y966_ASPNB|nr:hypothetical protein BO87DRAFT_461965 [Aspergillus neoniger CBS 115656]PYH30855.1 hypothetical protein BO87DRAFT_461965 [Aspergillus neoniger CBS 115656]
MPDSPSDDNDSRTAAVGPRAQTTGSRHSSRQSSHDPNPNPRKRRRRSRSADVRNVRDFVPQGATFSAAGLGVDVDATSSSGSDSDDGSSDGSDDDDDDDDAQTESAPAPPASWNKGSKSAIRTSLRSRAKPEESKPTSQFDSVNDKFWRSRSESVSSQGENEPEASKPAQVDGIEEGEVNEEEASDESSQMQLSGDSDDSESLGSEADDSILLNIGSRNGQSLGQDQDGLITPDGDDDYDPEALPVSNGKSTNGQTSTNQSKEDALLRFSKKYPTAPSTLADLDREDMDIQAKYRFYDRDVNAIDLQLPIACTECLLEGHLAEVCPSRECIHCGAWNQHQSSFCPTWRRCQRCRARGHDEDNCPSALKGSSSEFPCELCGSTTHIEEDCDLMWKLTTTRPDSEPVLVSLSCAHCTSNRHLIGDCPSLPSTRTLLSSSWTVRGIDPNMITNINSVVNHRRNNNNNNSSNNGNNRGGLKIRGRADHRPPSSDSDDMMAHRRAPVHRGGRGNIRIGSGIGRGNKNISGGNGYRDRSDFGPSRQRSMSPNPRSMRGRGGKDSWQGGGGRGKSSGGGGGSRPPSRGGNPSRGGGRGGKRGGGGGDAYRPLPSAAKKAWDKYRL